MESQVKKQKLLSIRWVQVIETKQLRIHYNVGERQGQIQSTRGKKLRPNLSQTLCWATPKPPWLSVG